MYELGKGGVIWFMYIPPLQVYRNFSETQTGTFSTERERGGGRTKKICMMGVLVRLSTTQRRPRESGSLLLVIL